VWWVLKTAKKNRRYNGSWRCEPQGVSGESARISQPVYDDVYLTYSPEFTFSHSEDNSIMMHYRSKRISLQGFVRGTISGLVKMHETPFDTELIQSRDDGSNHEIFKVSRQAL